MINHDFTEDELMIDMVEESNRLEISQKRLTNLLVKMTVWFGNERNAIEGIKRTIEEGEKVD